MDLIRLIQRLDAYIRRIADHHVKPLPYAEHPLGIKKGSGGVLVVGIPGSELLRRRISPAVAFEESRESAKKYWDQIKDLM